MGIETIPTQLTDQTPLSMSQDNIRSLDAAHPGQPINTICSTLRVTGRLDVALLQRAVIQLIRDVPQLRARVFEEGGEAFQRIDPRVPDAIPFYDFSITRAEGLAQWSRSVAREVMPLYGSPLFYAATFKLSTDSGGVLIKTHHIISDAWSQSILANRLAQTYLTLLSGETPQANPAPDYAEHVRAEREYLASPRSARDREFWRNKLTDLPRGGVKAHDAGTLSPIGRRRSYTLTDRLGSLMTAFCERKRVSPFSVLYMALGVYLHRVRGMRRFCVGVPVVNRRTFQEKQAVGMFVSTLPLVSEVNGAWSFDEFCDALTALWYEALLHQQHPFSEMRALAAEAGHTGSLFDIVLSFQNGRIFEHPFSRVSLEGRWHYSGYQAEPLCIHLSGQGESGRFLIDYDYLTQLFSAAEIDALHGCLTRILLDALSNPEKPLAALSLLDAAEEERVLFAFNNTQTPLPDASLAELLATRMEEGPARVAVIANGERLTYAALRARSASLARKLCALLETDPRPVALLLGRGHGLFVALCAVLFSGRAYLPLDATQPEARLAELIAGADCSLAITDTKRALPGVRTLSLEALEAIPEGDLSLIQGGAAYLVYTSGSTGKPKAVEVGQRAAINFALAMGAVYGRSAVLSVCNVGFDAFQIESLAALLNRRTIVLASAREQNDPALLARLIRGFDAGFLSMTPSRLSLYLKAPAFAAALGQVERILCGGERFPEELLASLRGLTGARIYNQYGPTEAAVGVSLARLDDAESITIGKPMPNCRVYILDGAMNPLPVGAAGELYIGGVCLSNGYPADPALTAERFPADPFLPGRRLYRTGDLAKWNERGELSFLGRRDAQLKLNGYRIEPAEIEEKLMAHPAVTLAAVKLFSPEQGRSILAAYFTAPTALDGAALLAFVSAYLPRYMIPQVAIRLPEMPVTDNGKIDYRSLPAPALEAGGAQPETDAEEAVLSIWRRVLKQPEMDVLTDYFLAGGDSLNAIEMLLLVEQRFGETLTLAELYRHSTARAFAKLLRKAPHALLPANAIPRAPEQAVYPLSPAQRSFYILHAMDEQGMAYNMPGRFALSAPLDAGRLEGALRRLIALDESLRTAFVAEGGEIVQKILPEVPFSLESVVSPEAFFRPFDLSAPPLLRAALCGDTLLLDMHHIISDGLSGAMLFARLDALYRGEDVATPPVRYRDYACWRAALPEETLAPQRAFWKKTLSGAPRGIDLPTDYERPARFDGRGARFALALGEALTAAVDRFCDENRVTPFTLFGAAFAAMLARLSARRDLVLGTPVSGRRHADLKEVTGAFVNTLPLRLDADPALTFAQFLTHVQESAAALLDNSDLTLDEIARLADAERVPGQNPFYNVLFSMLPVTAHGMSIGEASLTPLRQADVRAKLELSLEVERAGDGYRFAFDYGTAYYDAETVALWGRGLVHAISHALENPDAALGALPVTSPADALRLLDRPARLRVPFDDAPVDQLIDERALITPDDVAIEWGDERRYSFAQLRSRSDALAAYLIEQGAAHGDRIGVLAARDGDLIPVLLGILKAGCAYVPLDAAYPPQRMASMLETARASMLLCTEGLAPPEADFPCPVLPIRFSASPRPEAPNRSTKDICYILFTSGSTGAPKGVMVGHRAVANFLLEGERLLGTEPARVLCATSVIFDVFATETLMPLALGCTVVMADEEEMRLPWKMAERMARGRVHILQLTPSRMQLCLGDEQFTRALGGLKTVLLIGEPLTRALRDGIRAACPGRILNQYGPTEATVLCSFADVTESPEIHIGKPDANCRFMVLGEDGAPVPPTARGELCVGGLCLAEGYVGRDDLTEASFVMIDGKRFYKTGDVVRLRADGNYDFLGRRDRQIKLNGHRVELEEIASCLLASGRVTETAVLPVVVDGMPRFLRAFVVPKAGFDEASLRASLRDKLADYMIPSEIIQTPALPRTANGKTDMVALSRYEAAPDAPAAAPSDALSALRAIWADALGVRDVDETRSFFEQGGSSMSALMALSAYHKRGLTLSMDDFYRCPTLLAQARLLEGGEQKKASEQTAPRLPRHIPAPKPFTPRAGDTLLTGASGFLGAHLLEALLKQDDRRIILLVRDEARLRQMLDFYGISTPENRVQVWISDVTKPRLGLSESDYAALAARTAIIWHAAADVRHFAPEKELYAANVLGTENILSYAKRAGARVLHISTMSVCCGRAELTERDLDAGQPWGENRYVRSKALAEARVVESGVPASILRVGRLFARAKDGVFQANPETNAFWRALRGLMEMGCAPETLQNAALEVTSVDLCADACARVEVGELGAYHLYNPHTVPLSALTRNVKWLSDEAFSARLRDANTPYVAELSTLFAKDGGALSAALPDASATLDALARAGFTWPQPDARALSVCLRGEESNVR